MNKPDFTLDKIKFATDGPTFEKAVALYERGKVTQIEEGIRSYTAIVVGTKPYRVSVEARNFHHSSCSCYLGKNDTYCKHMLALAIYVVQDGKSLSDNDKKLVQNPTFSGKLGTLSDSELQEFAKLDPGCINAFDKLKNRETCFGWEKPLLKTFNRSF